MNIIDTYIKKFEYDKHILSLIPSNWLIIEDDSLDLTKISPKDYILNEFHDVSEIISVFRITYQISKKRYSEYTFEIKYLSKSNMNPYKIYLRYNNIGYIFNNVMLVKHHQVTKGATFTTHKSPTIVEL